MVQYFFNFFFTEWKLAWPSFCQGYLCSVTIYQFVAMASYIFFSLNSNISESRFLRLLTGLRSVHSRAPISKTANRNHSKYFLYKKKNPLLPNLPFLFRCEYRIIFNLFPAIGAEWMGPNDGIGQGGGPGGSGSQSVKICWYHFLLRYDWIIT